MKLPPDTEVMTSISSSRRSDSPRLVTGVSRSSCITPYATAAARRSTTREGQH